MLRFMYYLQCRTYYFYLTATRGAFNHNKTKRVGSVGSWEFIFKQPTLLRKSGESLRQTVTSSYINKTDGTKRLHSRAS